MTAPLHADHKPFVQTDTPNLQMPCSDSGPQGCSLPVSQAQPSLGVPLQLASSPVSHASAAAAWMLQSLQATPSASQVCVPFAQFPEVPSQGRVADGVQAP